MIFALMRSDMEALKRPEIGDTPADEQFRLLIANVADYAIFLMDPTGRIMSWNPGVRRIKGYDEDDVLGRHFSMFYLPGDRKREVPGQLLAAAERDGHVRSQGWRLRKDGSRFWADVTITALRSPTGALRGFAKVTRDMTEWRQAEESLREQRSLLTKAAGDLLALTRRLVEAEEAERRRLARELAAWQVGGDVVHADRRLLVAFARLLGAILAERHVVIGDQARLAAIVCVQVQA
jgi:PAS domain S-box-containing protein